MKKLLVVGLICAIMASVIVSGVVMAKGKDGPAGNSNVGHVDLFQKDTAGDWSILKGGAKAEVKYNLAGPQFCYKVNARGLMAETDYCLIYYADPWPGDGNTHSTGGLIASGTTNKGGSLHLQGCAELNTDLPNADDNNASAGPPCGDPGTPGAPPTPFPCSGAKIWLVPCDDYDATNGKMQAWNPENYLFEDLLINYDDTDV